MERIRKGNDYFGECECCDASHTEENPVKITVHYGNMWFCDSCWAKESEVTKELKATNQVQNVVTNALREAAHVDNTVQVRTDLFNAQTVSIINLKAEIDNNPEIVNKPYVLAEQLMARFEKFKSVIFEYNEKIVEANNAQKAIQVYLNQMANQLRSEEREKLKIADISYQPAKVKPVTPRSIKTTGTKKSTKLDKVELRKYAAELGVAEFTLQMVVVAKGCSIQEAAEMLKKSINAAKTQTATE
jgi:hypothetical protein